MRFIFLLPFIVAITNALVLVDSTLASACVYYEKGFEWGCGSHGNGMAAYACRCKNINWLGTITNCIKSNSDDLKLVEHGFKHIATRCYQKADLHYTLKDMWRIYENGTNYLRDPTTADLTNQVYTTLRVNQTAFDWYYTKFKDFGFSVQRSQWFGWGLVFYWVAVITVATLLNINRRFIGLNLQFQFLERVLALPPLISNGNESWRKYIHGFLPDTTQTRLRVLIVAVFVIQTFITAGVGYNLHMPDPYLNTQWFMNLDMLSYRVDMMSMSLFPVIFFFGIRNNPFIPISGLSFSTFNYFHKWCAYMCALLAFIHSIIWTVYSIHEGGGYKAWWVDAYWKWGIAAMVLLALLVFHSTRLLRDYAYEIFLSLHKIMNIVFIVCMYFHCVDMGWLGWIWSMVAIICFERAMRIARVILSGGLQTATMSYCGESVIKLTMKKPKYLKYNCGSYAFIYFIDFYDPWYYPWQSHPFTLLSTPNCVDDQLVAYFKAKKGITGHMLKKLFSSDSETIKQKIIIEGFYGNSPLPLKTNYKLVGVTAGLGVTAVYSYFYEILKDKTSTITNRFIWVVRNKNHLLWFSKELEWLAAHNCSITVVYTAEYMEETASETNSGVEPFEKMGDKVSIRNIDGRPNLQQLVSDELSSASKESCNVLFVGCGPTHFNNNLRAAISDETSSELNINVDYKEESFTW